MKSILIFFVFLANTSKLEEQIKRIPTFDRVSLKNICDKVEVPKDIKKYQPKVIAFEVDRYILDTLPEMIRCTKGNIFIITWDKFATEFRKTILRPLEIDELIEHVWKPTFEEWQHLHHRLKTGEIFFSEFERICGQFDQKTLKREFLLLEGVESDEEIHWIQERIDQMNKYRNLQNCLDGASVIMEVVEEFELKGNFNAIEQILKLVRFYIIQLLLKYLLGLIYAIVLFLFSGNGFLRVILHGMQSVRCDEKSISNKIYQ